MLKLFFNLSLVAALVLFVSASALAQSDNGDVQSWNDLQVTVPIAKKLDLYTVTTIQFGNNLSNIDNSRFGVGVTVKPTKRLSITPILTFFSERDSHNSFRYEYRFTFRGVYKYEFENFAVSHRSQAEYRMRPGANTWRYRPSITLEKELPKSVIPGLKVFVTEEPFYDSASGRFSRNRISAGVNKTLNKKVSLDLYFLHQDDNHSRPSSVNVFGTALKVAF